MLEFALCFPLMLLVLGFVIEGSRIMWSFQSVIAGVRDASRYLGRVAPVDTCFSGAPNAALLAQFKADYEDDLTSIVTTSLGVSNQLLPGGVSLKTNTKVLPSYRCEEDTNNPYRINPFTVASAQATITITLPFSGLLNIVSGGIVGSFDVDIKDEHRVFGI